MLSAGLLTRRLPALRYKCSVRGAVQPLFSSAVMPSIGTHSGTFHCDEALGCYLLKLTDRYGAAAVTRSRDAAKLHGQDVVIDVGGVFDPESQRFDHHQRGFVEVFGHGFGTKLSSAGLVYKYYGKEIIAKLLNLPESHRDVKTVYLAVYKRFMEAVDAIDNGINQWDTPESPRYIEGTNLSARVAKLNPRWNEQQSAQILDEKFSRAMELTGQEFLESVDYIAKAWLPARAVVEQALQQRHEVDSSGEILRLSSACPWKEHLYDLEEELHISPYIKYCLYEDDRENTWRIQAVSIGPGSFQNRLSLPAAWQGLRDAELSEASGIFGCTFVHASGFIGGNKSYDGALDMARQSLAEGQQSDSKRTKLNGQ